MATKRSRFRWNDLLIDQMLNLLIQRRQASGAGQSRSFRIRDYNEIAEEMNCGIHGGTVTNKLTSLKTLYRAIEAYNSGPGHGRWSDAYGAGIDDAAEEEIEAWNQYLTTIDGAAQLEPYRNVGWPFYSQMKMLVQGSAFGQGSGIEGEDAEDVEGDDIAVDDENGNFLGPFGNLLDDNPPAPSILHSALDFDVDCLMDLGRNISSSNSSTQHAAMHRAVAFLNQVKHGPSPSESSISALSSAMGPPSALPDSFHLVADQAISRPTLVDPSPPIPVNNLHTFAPVSATPSQTQSIGSFTSFPPSPAISHTLSANYPSVPANSASLLFTLGQATSPAHTTSSTSHDHTFCGMTSLDSPSSYSSLVCTTPGDAAVTSKEPAVNKMSATKPIWGTTKAASKALTSVSRVSAPITSVSRSLARKRSKGKHVSAMSISDSIVSGKCSKVVEPPAQPMSTAVAIAGFSGLLSSLNDHLDIKNQNSASCSAPSQTKANVFVPAMEQLKDDVLALDAHLRAALTREFMVDEMLCLAYTHLPDQAARCILAQNWYREKFSQNGAPPLAPAVMMHLPSTTSSFGAVSSPASVAIAPPASVAVTPPTSFSFFPHATTGAALEPAVSVLSAQAAGVAHVSAVDPGSGPGMESFDRSAYSGMDYM